MKSLRFLMVGGFLGAGKTTLLSELASRYQQDGLRVGVVTNDQAFGLVDTETFRQQGIAVEEVPGACFCCKFDELVAVLQKLSREELPDVLLAEPVGSCTDLIATVIQPLKKWHPQFEIGPLTVLCKPEHGLRILAGQSAGFSADAAYIFLKQLEEADIIAVSKLDKLQEQEAQALLAATNRAFPHKRVLALSATRKTGLEELLAALSETPTERANVEVDYATYASGEAELGWLNIAAEITAAESFDLDSVVLDLVQAIDRGLHFSRVEPAHIKVLATAASAAAIANLVASGQPPELSRSAEQQATHAKVLVNARAAGDPDNLLAIARKALNGLEAAHNAEMTVREESHFRPAPPQPTHRIAAAS